MPNRLVAEVFMDLQEHRGGDIAIKSDVQEMIDTGKYSEAAHLLLLITQPDKTDNTASYLDPATYLVGDFANGELSLLTATPDGSPDHNGKLNSAHYNPLD